MNIPMISEEKLQDVCYDLYKQQWLSTHVSPKEQFNKLREYVVGCLLGDIEDLTFDEWLWDTNGYNGTLFASKDEFLECEYLDSDYICDLLENPILAEIYTDYTKEDELEK